MKKLLLLILTAMPLLSSEWYTATSVTFGAKSVEHLPYSFDARVEQYFINDSMPKVYYKAGYFHEQLKIWDTEVDTAENILIGAGYNVLDFDGFFIDLGVSASYRFFFSSQSNQDAYVEYTDPIIVPYGEIGTGYSFGRVTLRADFLIGMVMQGEAQIMDSTTDEPLSDETYAYDQIHMNVGISYWW